VCQTATTDSTCPNVRANHTTSSPTAAAAAAAATTTTATGGCGLMCAPVLNADGNVIAVCLLSNKLPSADQDSGFTDDDEKVKGALSASADHTRSSTCSISIYTWKLSQIIYRVAQKIVSYRILCPYLR